MSAGLKKELKRILLALCIFFAIMIVEHTGVADGIMTKRIVRILLYAIPFLIAGVDVIRKAFLGIIHGQMMDESFLMTLASLGAFVTGEAEEAAAVMLFYQVGEWFQDYAVGKSRKSITDLMDIAPETANVEREDGSVEEIDPDDVEIGDTIVVKAGEKIPVDGTVLTGESMLNTAALTGESVPRMVRPGEAVISGCVNGEGMLRIRADKAYEDSTVAKILELVEESSEKKSKTENFITKFAKVYTPAVVIGAVILAVIPSLITGEWMTWLYRACTFLVISCPCALVISVPLSFFGGIGAASRNGVLVKGSNFLEVLAQVDTIVSDKTGTLTEGNFKVHRLLPADGITEEDLLVKAAAVEGTSTHPIALSIREEMKLKGLSLSADMSVADAENVAGKGLIALLGEDKIYVGSGKLLEANQIGYTPADDAASSIVYVAENDHYLGAILIRDTVKPGAVDDIKAMRSNGIKKIVMLTGDRTSVGEAVGRELGVDETYAELMPADKVSQVEMLLQREGKDGALAFVGDGINDAPVLMRADVGIAMGSMGSDAAIEAADVVIMDDHLDRIPMVLKIARRTLLTAKENIYFALIVKLLILVLGALGVANMWAAVFADVGVAVLCILNSMRLLTIRKTI